MNTHSASRRPWTRWLPYAGLLLLAGSLAWIRSTWLLPVVVNQDSMAPTLESGDLLLVDRQAYQQGDPERGDIVIFSAPGPQDHDYLVKRVIGLPGDLLTFTPWGTVHNGDSLAEWYLNEAWQRPPYYQVQVPEDNVFVMGDNRNTSEDSRHYGPVPINALLGRSTVLVWPWERFEPLEDQPLKVRPERKFGPQVQTNHT